MRLRVFVNKSFARFALKKAIDSAELCRSMWDAENGLIDAATAAEPSSRGSCAAAAAPMEVKCDGKSETAS
jgi:hypothetical protein